MNAIEQVIAASNQALDYTHIEQALWKETGTDEVMRLHCNETAFDISLNLKQQLVNKMINTPWNRYPDFHQTQLHALIAKEAGVSSENIVLGNGSSQGGP